MQPRPRRLLGALTALAAAAPAVALALPAGTTAGVAPRPPAAEPSPLATASPSGATFATIASRPARAGAGASSCPAVPGARALPDAPSVLGHPLDAAPLTPGEADAYLLALDRASPRIVTGVAGRSVRGRPLRYALVGDPADLSPARRAAISRAVRAVRAGALGRSAIARAADGPAVVWLGAGVHANEPSGTTAALALLRRLGTDDSCATRRTLDGALAVVVPDQNPDGRELGTRTNAADVDLNRDWFAASQPETTARLSLLSAFPPTIALDAHEQTGTDFFVPPYAEPVVAGLPAGTRRIADGAVSGAIDRALAGLGVRATHRGYDLLFPGYADSATSLLFGAGGMTLEQGSDLPLPEKARRHEAAMLGALGAVAADHAAVVRAWAAGFAAAERAGRAGRGSTGEPAFGWVLRTDRHGADARALAARLGAQGVRVRVLRHAARLRVDPLGPAGPASTRLPAGTIVVPADQPLARWADVLLGRDAGEAGAASAGADTWSAPRAAGVDAGVLRAAAPEAALRAFAAPATSRAASGAPVAFPGDSAAAGRLALRALLDGRPVARTAGGDLRTTASAAWTAAAAAAGLEVRPAGGPGADDAPLRLPRLVAPEDPSPLLTGTPAQLPATDRPAGWVAGALGAAGLTPSVVGAGGLDGGVPSGTTHVLLGPAALPGGAPSSAARDGVDRFVRAGGTVVAVGAAGHDAAAALGVTAVRTEPPASSSAVAVRALPGTDPVGRTLGGTTSVIVAGEPGLVAPAGATVVLRAASGSALAPSGALGAGTGLAGRPLVVDEARGAGHVLTLGFSPAFRRQSAGGEHVLLALLLARG